MPGEVARAVYLRGENDKGPAQSIFMSFTRGSTNSLTSLFRVMHRCFCRVRRNDLEKFRGTSGSEREIVQWLGRNCK